MHSNIKKNYQVQELINLQLCTGLVTLIDQKKNYYNIPYHDKQTRLSDLRLSWPHRRDLLCTETERSTVDSRRLQG